MEAVKHVLTFQQFPEWASVDVDDVDDGLASYSPRPARSDSVPSGWPALMILLHFNIVGKSAFLFVTCVLFTIHQEFHEKELCLTFVEHDVVCCNHWQCQNNLLHDTDLLMSGYSGSFYCRVIYCTISFNSYFLWPLTVNRWIAIQSMFTWPSRSN